MDFSLSFKICGAGMAASRTKMDVVASNLANAETTRTPEGGPYKRKSVVLSAETPQDGFGGALKDALRTVKVDNIAEDNTGFKTIYNPGHPDADEKGMVSLPNVNLVTEMADMITAARSFEACATAYDATKNMALRTLDLGK